MQSSPKWLIVGGGISGLAAAQSLQAANNEYMLLEQCPELGGLTRTVQVADFCFDYTGHFLHLSRYKSPSVIPYAHLRNEEWLQVQRKSYFFADDRLITAPIQYHLGELSDATVRECMGSYESRPKNVENADSFREYIVSGFGRTIADRFLIPQNEKTMAISLDRLSVNAVKRFFPPPDEKRIRSGFLRQQQEASEYNSTFWYPKQGGIGLLVQGLATGLRNAAVGEEIVAIDLGRRTVSTKAGHHFTWDIMLPSMPLKMLCALTNNEELRSAAAQLSHSSTISFNYGIRGSLPDELRNAHWIYVPDRSIPFYRFGCYSNISTGVCSKGYSAVYVETAVDGRDVDDIDIAGDLQPKVTEALENLRWVRHRDIVCIVTHVIRCAYIHDTPERQLVIDRMRSLLGGYGIYPIGRYGMWDYTSMEDSIESALTTVKENI